MRVIDIVRFNIQRKIVASQTVASWQNIPHVSYIFEPDVTDFIEKYNEFKKTLPEDLHITLNTVIVKAITEGLKAAPKMNAHLHYELNLFAANLLLMTISTFQCLGFSTVNDDHNMRDMGMKSYKHTNYMKRHRPS